MIKRQILCSTFNTVYLSWDFNTFNTYILILFLLLTAKETGEIVVFTEYLYIFFLSFFFFAV